MLTAELLDLIHARSSAAVNLRGARSLHSATQTPPHTWSDLRR